MKREDLKKIEGLTDDQINSIMDLHKNDVNSWNTKLTEKDNELTAEKDKVSSLTKDLEKFKDVDLEELKSAKTKYDAEKQQLIDDHTKEINDMKFNSALELAVIDTKTVDPIALKAHLDSSKLKYNEETKKLDGFDEQVATLKQSYGYLFSTKATGGSHGNLGGDDNSNVTLNGALTEHYK